MVKFRDDTDAGTWDDVQKGFHRPPDFMPTPKTILDLGSHAGFTVIDFMSLYPEADIVGVEMDKDNYQAALKNIDEVGWDYRVVMVNAAVDTRDGTCFYDKSLANNSYRISSLGNAIVTCFSLDTIIEKFHHYRDIDFAKIDIEGVEREIFKSSQGKKWPDKIRALKVELHNDYTVEEAISDLNALGYEAMRGELHPYSVFAWR